MGAWELSFQGVYCDGWGWYSTRGWVFIGGLLEEASLKEKRVERRVEK